MKLTIFALVAATIATTLAWQLIFGLPQWPNSWRFAASLLTLLVLLPIGTKLSSQALEQARNGQGKPVLGLLLFILTGVALLGVTLWLGVRAFVQML